MNDNTTFPHLSHAITNSFLLMVISDGFGVKCRQFGAFKVIGYHNMLLFQQELN